jgi:hypothetical protein
MGQIRIKAAMISVNVNYHETVYSDKSGEKIFETTFDPNRNMWMPYNLSRYQVGPHISVAAHNLRINHLDASTN